jgi:hypothetical protein
MRCFAAVLAAAMAFVPFGAAASPADDAFVRAAYQVLLGHSPQASALNLYSQQLSTTGDRLAVINSIMNNEDEFRQAEINALYLEYLHRPANPANQSALKSMVGSGAPLGQAASFVLGSPEYFALPIHGGVSVTPNTNDGFIRGVYQDLLARQPDQSAAFFIAQLQGNITRQQVALEALQGSEAASRFQSMLAHRVLHGPSAPTGTTLAETALAEINAGLVTRGVDPLRVGALQLPTPSPKPPANTSPELNYNVLSNTSPGGRKATLFIDNHPFQVEQWRWAEDKSVKPPPNQAAPSPFNELRMTIVIDSTAPGLAQGKTFADAELNGGGTHATMLDVRVSKYTALPAGAGKVAHAEVWLTFSKLSIGK